jgi:RNA polymerase sigma-70 factor (ECF subfamily)
MRAPARDFKEAWEAKDIDALIGLLDPDAMAIGDGGDLVSAEPLLASGSHFEWPLAHGMSTRKVDDLVRMLRGDSGISKSKASGICADLDAEGGPFRTLNGTNSHRTGSCSPGRSPTTSASAARRRPGPRWRRRPRRSAPTG